MNDSSLGSIHFECVCLVEPLLEPLVLVRVFLHDQESKGSQGSQGA